MLPFQPKSGTWEWWQRRGALPLPQKKKKKKKKRHHWNLIIRLFNHIKDTHWEGSYTSAEVQSVYSTVPANWANSSSTKPIAGEIRGFIPFPKGIRPKENVTDKLEFKLAYYNIAVQHVSYYTMEESSTDVTSSEG